MPSRPLSDSSKTIESILRISAILWFSIILTVFIFYPPYWALMDDGYNLEFAVNHYGGRNLWQWVVYFTSDVLVSKMGRFQPIYPIYMYLFYGTFVQSSFMAYLTTFFINIIVFWLWSGLFAKCLEKTKVRTFEQIAIYRLLFFVSCFLFTPHYNLFFFASLAERLVLLFGSLVLYEMIRISEMDQMKWKSGILLLLGLVLALLTKEFSLFLIPFLTLWLLVLWYQKKDFRLITLAVLLLTIGIGFGIFLLSIRTGYSSRYQISSLNSIFLKIGPRFYLFLATALVSFGTVLYRHLKNGKAEIKNALHLLVWPINLLCFLTIMLPWGNVGSYYIASAGVFVVGSFLLILDFILSRFHNQNSFRIVFLVIFIALGSVFSLYRLTLEARQHHGTKLVVNYLKKELIEHHENLIIRMPEGCYEASIRLSFFVGKPGSVQLLGDNSDPFFSTSIPSTRKLLIVNKECHVIPAQFQIRKTLLSHPPWYIYES